MAGGPPPCSSSAPLFSPLLMFCFSSLLLFFSSLLLFFVFFFFNDTATTEIYTLSLHDALPISKLRFYFVWPSTNSLSDVCVAIGAELGAIGMIQLLDYKDLSMTLHKARLKQGRADDCQDRKSTRLNSSHW